MSIYSETLCEYCLTVQVTVEVSSPFGSGRVCRDSFACHERARVSADPVVAEGERVEREYGGQPCPHMSHWRDCGECNPPMPPREPAPPGMPAF